MKHVNNKPLNEEPYKTSSFTYPIHAQVLPPRTSTGALNSVLTLTLSNTPDELIYDDAAAAYRTEDCPENYLSEQYIKETDDFEKNQYLHYPLSLINTKRKEGEENCTCSSDEEVVEEEQSFRRVTTTDYGGREIVIETEEQ